MRARASSQVGLILRWSAMVAFGAGLLAAGPARADNKTPATADCSVRMIDAFHEPGGVDSRITVLRPYLERAPFTAWRSFRLVEEKNITIAHETTQKFALPNGSQAALTFVQHLLRPDGKHRLRLRLEIEKSGQKVLDTTFVLDEGGVVLQAGQKHGRGLLVLGFSCAIPNG